MWIGLLTQGTHPSRAAASSKGLATLFAWGSQERVRVDGPQAHLAAGVRMMRRTSPSTVGAAFQPRCFDCRQAYLIPDPDEIRAREDIQELGAGPDADPDPEPDADAATPGEGAGLAVFALVHVADTEPIGDEGEALIHVPGSPLVMLIPFQCLPEYAGVLGRASAGLLPQPCDRCGALAPGGPLGEANRASCRLGTRRSGGRHRAA
jgi:hypothetical protein